MGKWFLNIGHSAGESIAAATTRYCAPLGGKSDGSGTLFSTTEANAALLVRDAMTWSNLYVRVTVNACGADTTVRSQVGLPMAFGNQIVTIGAGATGAFEDAVNTDAIAAGQYFDWRITTGAGGAVTFTVIASCLTGSTYIVGAYDGYNSQGVGTGYYPVVGSARVQTARAQAQVRFRVAGTLSNMFVYCYSNTSANDNIMSLEIGGIAVNQHVHIAAGATGAFEDAVNTDAVVAGDLVNGIMINANGTLRISIHEYKFTGGPVVGASDGFGTTTIAFGVTRFAPISCNLFSVTATEANTQFAVNTTVRARNMFAYVRTNTLNGNCVIRFRKNTANGNQSVTFGAGATGILEDLVNTDDLVPANVVNWGIDTTAAGAGAILIDTLKVEQTWIPARSFSSVANRMIAAELI